MSIFNSENQDLKVCVECGFETRSDVSKCPNCSNSYESGGLYTGKDLVLWGIYLLVFSAVPVVLALFYCLSNGFSAFFAGKGPLIVFCFFWFPFVKGILWTTLGNRLENTKQFSSSKAKLFLMIEIATYLFPFLIYFMYAYGQ